MLTEKFPGKRESQPRPSFPRIISHGNPEKMGSGGRFRPLTLQLEQRLARGASAGRRSKRPNSGGAGRPFWIVRVSETLREQSRSCRFGGSQPRGSRPSVRLEAGSVPGGSGGGGRMSAEAADREAATSSRPCTPPQTCWFEFLLEESLLEKHLRKPCPGKRGACSRRGAGSGQGRCPPLSQRPPRPFSGTKLRPRSR